MRVRGAPGGSSRTDPGAPGCSGAGRLPLWRPSQGLERLPSAPEDLGGALLLLGERPDVERGCGASCAFCGCVSSHRGQSLLFAVHGALLSGGFGFCQILLVLFLGSFVLCSLNLLCAPHRQPCLPPTGGGPHWSWGKAVSHPWIHFARAGWRCSCVSSRGALLCVSVVLVSGED